MYVVGLGSNLGARYATLADAVARLDAAPDCRVIARSRVYESPPFGPVPQPHYLNAAVLVESALDPEALLAELLHIETSLGRVRDVRWGPRTIDLDLLWSPRPISSTRLTLPHPGLPERWFALAPLLDAVREALVGQLAEPARAELAPLAATAQAQLAALGGVPDHTPSAAFGAEAASAYT
jgi:2-amino-4-hydroxy-6-hydroxymethyldihydropteridine diphosphokinase